jgi:hypothetical protein
LNYRELKFLEIILRSYGNKIRENVLIATTLCGQETVEDAYG